MHSIKYRRTFARPARVSPSTTHAALGSMVAGVPFPRLAAKHAVLHCVIDEDQRQDDHRAHERKLLARVARRRLPDRQRWRHDIRPDADDQAAVAEKTQREREHEWQRFMPQTQRTEDAPYARDHENRHWREPRKIAAAEPA